MSSYCVRNKTINIKFSQKRSSGRWLLSLNCLISQVLINILHNQLSHICLIFEKIIIFYWKNNFISLRKRERNQFVFDQLKKTNKNGRSRPWWTNKIKKSDSAHLYWEGGGYMKIWLECVWDLHHIFSKVQIVSFPDTGCPTKHESFKCLLP